MRHVRKNSLWGIIHGFSVRAFWGIERFVHHDLKSLGRDEIQKILDVKTLHELVLVSSWHESSESFGETIYLEYNWGAFQLYTYFITRIHENLDAMQRQNCQKLFL